MCVSYTCETLDLKQLLYWLDLKVDMADFTLV